METAGGVMDGPEEEAGLGVVVSLQALYVNVKDK